MNDPLHVWLAAGPDPAMPPPPEVLTPAPDYATIARLKATIVQQTGLLGLASIWGGRQLVYRHFLAHGSDAQRAAWAGKALSVAISEPKVGAHPKLLTTRADPAGDGFRLTGHKAWVTNGPLADAIIVFAITQQTEGRKRYTAFIVPRDTPGLSMQDMPGFHALRPSRHCLLTLDGCEVGTKAILGEPGTAYERMALTFRDVEDAVGTFATLGALRHAVTLCDAATDPTGLGAIVALNSVFAAAAEAVVAALDAGRLRTGDATLVGLRLLAQDIVTRLTGLQQARLGAVLTDLGAVLGIAQGPRMARQAALGAAALRAP